MEALGHYLVELHRPASGWELLQETAARARESADGLRAEGTPVRMLRSIFVPDNDSCFLLYEATSAEAVREAGRRAALAIQGIGPAIQVEDREPDRENGEVTDVSRARPAQRDRVMNERRGRR